MQLYIFIYLFIFSKSIHYQVIQAHRGSKAPQHDLDYAARPLHAECREVPLCLSLVSKHLLQAVMKSAAAAE